MRKTSDDILVEAAILPERRSAFFGGAWHSSTDARRIETINPGTGESLGSVEVANEEVVDAAVTAAEDAFRHWRRTTPAERAQCLRSIASVVEQNGRELALLDAADCGNPVTAMMKDIDIAATTLNFFAGLIGEIKGDTVPMGPDRFNFTLREPYGVVGRIVAFNHPLMFCVAKMAAPIAAGNTVVMKPPEQAPLSALRFAELIDGILPPGVFNLILGDAETGAALAAHPRVAKIALIGSVPTGKAVMRTAADTIKDVMLELGGKNALIAYPDADVDKLAQGIARGMNFAWCGQSCGSTSRAFLHEDIHDDVVDRLSGICRDLRPGLPTDPDTKMGAIIDKRQYDRITAYIEKGVAAGARLVCGGGPPDDPALRNGFFIEPTVFCDVTPDMTIAREEIFGPVLSVLRWRDEEEMLQQVNSLDVGLSCSIWTRDIERGLIAAGAVQAGFVWINDAGPHFTGAPFGGYKQSGIGREESLSELMAFTQEKNVNVNFG